MPIGYCPIGSPNRPDRDRTATDTVDIEDPVIVRIADRLGVHPGIVCIKWAVQRGQIPIPFSVKRPQYLSGLKAVVGDLLADDDMRAIAAIDKNCRLIKGAQPFLATCALGFRDPAAPSGLWSCPEPETICAVAGGYAYLSRTTAPERFTMIAPYRPVLEIRPIVEECLLLFVSHHSILAWGRDGQAYK